MTTKLLKCPGCFDRDSLRRSHVRLMDLPFRLIGMRTYRCLTCYRRFHTWKHAGSSHEAHTTGKVA